mgnify:CR=1 FL=1
MGLMKRNASFLLMVGAILLVGAAIFGGVVAVRVAAATGSNASSSSSAASKSNNGVSSFGLGNVSSASTATAGYQSTTAAGYKSLTIEPTTDTPAFISESFDDDRGVVLLVYCAGASDDMEMLSYLSTVKAQYSSSFTFRAVEARTSGDLGDTLDQLRVSNPPILAIIRADGEVSELYTGWVSLKTFEQRVADAARGL